MNNGKHIEKRDDWRCLVAKSDVKVTSENQTIFSHNDVNGRRWTVVLHPDETGVSADNT